MKKPILVVFAAFALLVASSPQMLAQISNYQTNIYFDSGKDALDSKAIAELEAFATKIALLEDFEVDIRAYTDDMGTVEYNKALSERRATNAFNFLLSKKIQPAKQEIVGAGILPTDKKLDKKAPKEALAEARSRNRRVDVRVTIFTPKTIGEVQNYFGQRDKNTCLFSGQKDTAIQGQKGTVLFVAANSFEQKDGKSPALPIKIELREAYTFADMILQNLTTLSNGQLLQTGGMVHISATDANGQELQLAAGKKIDIAMPLKGELPKGMQLFTADRPAADNGTGINWIAQPDTFILYPSSPRPARVVSYIKNTSSHELKNKPVAFPSQPIYIKDAKAPKPPHIYLSKSELPTIADIQKKNPRERFEREGSYEIRIAKIHEEKKDAHAKTVAKNEERQQKYNADLLQYREDSLKYASHLYAANAYTDSVEQAMIYILISSEAHACVENLNREANFFYSLKNQIRNIDSLAKNAQSLGFTAIAEKYKALAQKANKNIGDAKQLQALQASLANIQQDNVLKMFSWYNISIMSVISDSYISKQDFTRVFSGSLRKKYAQRVDATDLNAVSFEKYCENFYKKAGYALYSGEFLAKATQIQADIDAFDLAEKTKVGESISQDVHLLYKELMAMKADAGLLSPQEGKSLARTMVSSANLGWINCDRFLDYKPEECEKLAIDIVPQQNQSLIFYAIVPEINAVTQFTKTKTGYQLGYQGIPKHMQVKLVGFFIENGKFNLCIYEDKAEALKHIDIKFQPCKLSDINKALANL